MKHISILVPKGEVALGCIEGPYKLFSLINDFLGSMGKPPAFSLHLVGVSLEAEKYHGSFAVFPDATLRDIVKTDLIIIPAINGNKEEVLRLNSAFIPWMVTQYKKGAELASLCVGTFLLAATGLLEGRNCTTHWQSVNDFRKMFPSVNLLDNKIITDEYGIYTSGGANLFWNLLLYLVEKYTNRELAILASKYLIIEIERDSQSPFILFSGQKEHEDDEIRKAQDFIEDHFEERLTVDQLSSQFAIGRRSLERRFKKATSNTVTEYMQRVKIEAAKKSFESSRKNINEVMQEVGYADTKAFRMVFKKFTGMSPIDYRNKYNKEMSVH